jgi:hypothetical protein
MLSPTVRRAVLVIHVLASAGWAGAVAVFLALALTGLVSPDRAQASYVAMQIATLWIIQPLSFIAPATGLLLACGTRWGLFTHYWVLIKATIILPATALLLLHDGPINHLATVALTGPLPATAHATQIQMAVDAGLALLALALATVLGIVKPAGLTPFGRRR